MFITVKRGHKVKMFDLCPRYFLRLTVCLEKGFICPLYVKQINNIYLRTILPLLSHHCQELVSVNKPVNGKVGKTTFTAQNLYSQVTDDDQCTHIYTNV